jgi:probable phosphoglycerate mutase
MTRILLTRHGHVEGIKPARFRGRAELELTEHGLAQADALARRIAASWKPAAVFTSPLHRCVLTGGKIAAACGIESEARDGLGDIDYGAWQMRTHDEVSAESPEAYRQWRSAPQLTRFPKGESLQDVMARATDVLREALVHYPEQTVVLVGHDSEPRAVAAASRHAAGGLLAAGPGPLHPERDRNLPLGRRAGAAGERHESSGPGLTLRLKGPPCGRFPMT